jgi:hypothetical protein
MKYAGKTLVLIAVSLTLSAFVFANDPWQEFSIAKNPNGVWSYGFTLTLGGPLYLADRQLVSEIYPSTYVQGYDVWARQAQADCGDGVGGGIAHYPGQYINGSELHFEDTLEEHPGCHGEYATVRWTAPLAGTYQFVGSFNGMQLACGGTTTDVHIRWNSINALFDANVSGFTTNRDHFFNVQQAVAAGDSVDFLVGYGNGNYSCDATALQLAVDLVSSLDVEPGTTPNTISRSSKLTVPVAILSTASFDAPAMVAQGSLTFGRIGNEASLVYNSCTETDVNNDGLNDLVCQFKIQKAAFQLSDTVATLHGKTKTGVTFVGTDSVVIVP